MLPIQSWEMDDARSEWANVLLNVSAQHCRPVVTPTASGGQSRTYTVIDTVNCFIEPGYPGEPRDVKEADGQVVELFFSLHLPYDVTVQKEDRFIINHVNYEVVDTDRTDDPDLTVEVVQLVRVRRIKGAAGVFFLPNAIVANAAIMPATLTVS